MSPPRGVTDHITVLPAWLAGISHNTQWAGFNLTVLALNPFIARADPPAGEENTDRAHTASSLPSAQLQIS